MSYKWGSIYNRPGSRKTARETLVVSIHLLNVSRGACGDGVWPGHSQFPNCFIVSDHGVNFVGADHELRELMNGLARKKIEGQTMNKGVVLKSTFGAPLQRGSRSYDKGGKGHSCDPW